MDYQDILDDLKKTKTNYEAMFDYCTQGHYVMANSIVEDEDDWETYCGCRYDYFDGEGNEITQQEYNSLIAQGKDRDMQPTEVYQYFIIDQDAAVHFKRYTNQTVIYNGKLGLFVLCLYHCGTPWESVPSDWADYAEEDD